ncbi:MAG: tetratricopeptide repeat protein [candidate division Zixibacteria bacterium]|nr:tetratricopeptide repeat protein [candidate division Zixibacteria bacterium]
MSLTTIFTSCSTSQNDAETDRTGLELIENRKFNEADSVFNEILKGKPGSIPALYGQGLVFERQLFFYDALKNYMTIIENDASYAPALEGVMRINGWLGLKDELEQAAWQYGKLNFDDWSDNLILAETYIKLEQSEQAAKYLSRAEEMGLDGAVADVLRAGIYRLEGKFDTARTVFAKALAAPTGSALFYNEVADFYDVSGMSDSAVTFGEKAVEADQKNFNIFLNQFFRCLKNGYFSAARNIMKRMEDNEDTFLLRNYLDFYYFMNRPEYYLASISAFKNLQKRAKNISTFFNNVVARVELRDQMTTDNQINQIITQMDNEGYAKLFVNYMNQRLAGKLLDIRDFLRAENILKGISGWRLESREYNLSRAYIYHNTALFDEYNALMDTIYNRHSTQPDWLTAMADIYSHWTIHKYPDAEKYYRLALKENPRYRPAYRNLVQMYYDIKQYDKAIKIAEEYPEFVRRYPAEAIEKAFCLLELGRYDEGLALFEKNIVPLKGDIILYEKVIDLLMRKYEFDRVKKTVDLMLSLCPDNPDILVFSAVTETDLQDYKKALQLAEKALEIEPNNFEAAVQKAYAEYWLGRKEASFAAFEEMKKNNPFSQNLQLFYSMALVDAKKDMGKTGNLVRGSITIYRYALKSHLNLVDYYRQTGKYDFAEQEAYNMATLFDDHPKAFYYLGWMRFLSKKDGAREDLQKAIKLGLKGEELTRARDLLKKLG